MLKNIRVKEARPTTVSSSTDRGLYKLVSRTGLKKTVRPLYYALENFIAAGAAKKNKDLKDLYKNQRCFILGNGVSLNEIDISKLADEWTFGCGCLYLHKDIGKLNLKFFVATYAVRESSRGNVGRYLDHFSTIEKTFSNPETIFFVRAINKELFQRHNILRRRRVYYLKPKQPLPAEQAVKEPIDLTKRSGLLPGSMSSMLTTAVYMGFKEIYLCGCGYTYEPQQVYHFYDYDPVLTAADRIQDPSVDPRPFFPLSIPEGKRKEMINEFAEKEGLEVYRSWPEGSYEKVIFVSRRPLEEEYEIFARIAKLNGVKIYNVVPDGFKSAVFEKVTWPEIAGLVDSSRQSLKPN